MGFSNSEEQFGCKTLVEFQVLWFRSSNWRSRWGERSSEEALVTGLDSHFSVRIDYRHRPPNGFEGVGMDRCEKRLRSREGRWHRLSRHFNRSVEICWWLWNNHCDIGLLSKFRVCYETVTRRISKRISSSIARSVSSGPLKRLFHRVITFTTQPKSSPETVLKQFLISLKQKHPHHNLNFLQRFRAAKFQQKWWEPLFRHSSIFTIWSCMRCLTPLTARNLKFRFWTRSERDPNERKPLLSYAIS